MCEIEKKKTWTELLPSLFDLLVENADGVIDDTSLERILEWLKNVCKNEQQLQKLLQCGTVEFMSRDKVFSNPESTAFSLRLLGFLTSREEVFLSLTGDFVAGYLEKPRNASNLWNEGIVRNGYFQALISLTEHKDGILWIRNTGHVLCALDCISDRSMFVASSARTLIAKFIVKEREWMVDQNVVTVNSTLHCSDQHKVIIERLKSMLNPELSPSTTSMIAAIEVTRNLLCENSPCGQKVLHQSRLFMDCLNLIKVGDAVVCQKLVDMICEMAKTRWSLEWDSLVNTGDTSGTSAAEVLLGLCVNLFKEGHVSTALELVAGLGPCQESSRDFPRHWLETLFDVTELTLDVIMNPTCHNTEESQNGCHVNGSDHSDSGLVKGLLSYDDQRRCFAKKQLQHILFPWVKESTSLTHVICQGLAAAQQLTQQASSRHISHVSYWLKLSLNLLHTCIHPTDHSSVKLHGNQKVLKALLEFIGSFAEVQKSRGIFEGTESNIVDQVFDDVVGALLQLIENSETSGAVISAALKTLGKVLDAARPAYITELFLNDKKTSDEFPSEKRAKLDHSLSCQGDVRQNSNTKPSNCQKLAFMLHRRLRDTRWEVKDSTLEFVAALVQLNQDPIHEFLCFHNIPMIVWNTVDDSESYTRASAIHLIGSLAYQSKLWTSLLQNNQISEEDVLKKLSLVLVEDDEAFPRRRAMECLTLWVSKRNPIAERILRPGKAVEDLSQNERCSTSDAVQGFKVGSQSETADTSSGFELARSVCRACQDFDWEVKLRGLEFWEAVIGYLTRSKVRKEGADTNKVCSDESLHDRDVEKCFQVLFAMGALSVLNEALNDCDHMVTEKALKVLASLQHVANPDNSTFELCIKTSTDFREALGKGFSFVKFKEVLLETDLSAVAQSCEAADSALRGDPVSLIEDILLAAERHDENLLDCY